MRTTLVHVNEEDWSMSGIDRGLDKEEHLQRMYDKDGRNTSSTDPIMMESRLFIGNLASEQVITVNLNGGITYIYIYIYIYTLIIYIYIYLFIIFNICFVL